MGRLLKVAAGIAVLCCAVAAVLAGCAPARSASSHAQANPTASADAKAAEHIATQVLDTCIKASGGTQSGPKLTIEQALVQPHMITVYSSHSGRHQFWDCVKAHSTASQMHAAEFCSLRAFATDLPLIARGNGPSTGPSSVLGQSIFQCAAKAFQ